MINAKSIDKILFLNKYTQRAQNNLYISRDFFYQTQNVTRLTSYLLVILCVMGFERTLK